MVTQPTLESLNITKLNSVKEGKLVELARGTEDIRKELGGEINQVTAHIFNWGDKGGNHYHKEKVEVMAVLDGEILVCLVNLKSKLQLVQTVYAGHRFTLLPNFAHALHNPNQKNAYVLEFSNLRFNPENPMNDVYKYPII
ncbi:MAG: hypothetical protein AABX17_04140 [Nanoarchaeota archaeon]